MFDQNAILLTALLQIQKEVIAPNEGICYNVEMATLNTEGADDLEMTTIMSEIFPKWPEFSGDVRYPVPYGNHDPMTIFHGFNHHWEDTYGDSRKRLLSFLIAELQEKSE